MSKEICFNDDGEEWDIDDYDVFMDDEDLFYQTRFNGETISEFDYKKLIEEGIPEYYFSLVLKSHKKFISIIERKEYLFCVKGGELIIPYLKKIKNLKIKLAKKIILPSGALKSSEYRIYHDNIMYKGIQQANDDKTIHIIDPRERSYDYILKTLNKLI